MRKVGPKVGDYVRLVGPMWAKEYPIAPKYVRLTNVENGFYRAEHVGDVGLSELYGIDNEPDWAVEYVSASEMDWLKEDTSDATLPDYYTFGDVEVRQISGHLTSFAGQAVQYLCRSSRLDGQNKGDAVEDLKKSIRFIQWEIERLEVQQ